MALVRFKNSEVFIEAEAGTKLSDCIRKAGLLIETPCNCIGKCGKCRVKAVGALHPPTEEEKRFISADEDIRMACMTRINGDVEIELFHAASSLKTINRGVAVDVEVNSDTRRVSLPSLDKGSSKPYLEILPYKIVDYTLLEKLAEAENIKHTALTGVVLNNKLVDISSNIPDILGVAVDIGTTGISAYLVDLESGEVLNKVSALNPQTQYGGDVLTRISYCMNHIEGSRLLKEAITREINDMIGELIEIGYNRNSVYRVAVAGNTTMQHLFLGIDTRSIAKAPYRPVFLDRIDVKASELSIHINKQGVLTMLPSASGYVGADILAGIVATDFHKTSKAAIFIDIGTNGEIAAIYDSRLAATSTAAGPALEGMNISCGCRAEAGAIDSFCIDENYNISYTTIGNTDAKGICGSGLIDVAAYLVQKEIILKNGKFNTELDARIKDRLRDKKFYLTEDIYISQKDIRQIQLAKGAIASGIAMLLAEIQLPVEKVEEAVIAGAFGYHINPKSILEIGLIPKGFKGKITFVGNSSVEGARLALINQSSMEAMTALKDKIKVLELSTRAEFQQYFVSELSF